ncbi:MAG TPA: enoyl-CoA hydratase-related protein [Cryomorphaceae bacterium]|nr:enoyl-CoA hydratase-related protein [Cryomorphaceae bacterium]
MNTIDFKIDAGIASIIFNRPEVFNSFNKEMAMDLQEALDQCYSDTSVRCVVLRGTGKAFSAGQDLKEVTDPQGPPLTSIVRDHYNPIIERIRKLNKPVVAAVNGVAAGAGANIALACDIVVACESASFLQAFSKIGLIPDSGGTFFLPRLIGWQKASALMMLGEKIPAAEAEELGMIYKAIPDNEFDTEIEKITSKLSTMATKGLAYTKIALNQSMHNNLSAQLSLEEQLQTKAGATGDYKEGVAAFLEKRKPEFTGS